MSTNVWRVWAELSANPAEAKSPRQLAQASGLKRRHVWTAIRHLQREGKIQTARGPDWWQHRAVYWRTPGQELSTDGRGTCRSSILALRRFNSARTGKREIAQFITNPKPSGCALAECMGLTPQNIVRCFSTDE